MRRIEVGLRKARASSAFKEFVADVNSLACPEEKHIVRMAPEELSAFLERLDGRG